MIHSTKMYMCWSGSQYFSSVLFFPISHFEPLYKTGMLVVIPSDKNDTIADYCLTV